MISSDWFVADKRETRAFVLPFENVTKANIASCHWGGLSSSFDDVCGWRGLCYIISHSLEILSLYKTTELLILNFTTDLELFIIMIQNALCQQPVLQFFGYVHCCNA